MLNRSVPVWLKVDTGMGRFGIAPETAQQAYQRLAAIPGANELFDIHLLTDEQMANVA